MFGYDRGYVDLLIGSSEWVLLGREHGRFIDTQEGVPLVQELGGSWTVRGSGHLVNARLQVPDFLSRSCDGGGSCIGTERVSGVWVLVPKSLNPPIGSSTHGYRTQTFFRNTQWTLFVCGSSRFFDTRVQGSDSSVREGTTSFGDSLSTERRLINSL